MEREAFWLENASLPQSEIIQRWTTKCAPLSAIVGGSAPTHPVDLGSALEEQASEHNNLLLKRILSTSRSGSVRLDLVMAANLPG